jgi:hypothetical protein
MDTKQFHISDVLSVTTGRLVSTRHIDGLYDILSFMTGESVFTHQLGRFGEECKPYLLKQFPQLDSPEIQTFAVGELVLMMETDAGKNERASLILGWLSKITSGKYGVEVPEMLDIAPIPKEAHMSKNPISELIDMVGPDRVIVVTTPEV